MLDSAAVVFFPLSCPPEMLTGWGCGRRGMAFVGFGYQAKTFVQEQWQLYILYTMLLVAFIYTLGKH